MRAFDEGGQRPITGDGFEGRSIRITNIELTTTRRTLRARRYGYSDGLRAKNAGIIVANQRYTFHFVPGRVHANLDASYESATRERGGELISDFMSSAFRKL
jgi:hypothetical protein